jgi:hypothetical protein
MRQTTFSLLIALSMLATSALASEPQQVLVQTDAVAIMAQQQEIRQEAAAGKGRYKGMKQEQRDQLAREQDIVQRLLAGRERTTDLPPEAQLEVFNALEAISAIVNKAEDGRLVCESRKPTGSNRKQTTCRTVAQIRAQRERDTHTLQRRDQQCTDGWGSQYCAN